MRLTHRVNLLKRLRSFCYWANFLLAGVALIVACCASAAPWQITITQSTPTDTYAFRILPARGILSLDGEWHPTPKRPPPTFEFMWRDDVRSIERPLLAWVRWWNLRPYSCEIELYLHSDSMLLIFTILAWILRKRETQERRGFEIGTAQKSGT